MVSKYLMHGACGSLQLVNAFQKPMNLTRNKWILCYSQLTTTRHEWFVTLCQSPFFEQWHFWYQTCWFPKATAKKLSKAKNAACLNDGSSGRLLNYIYLLCSRCDDNVLKILFFQKHGQPNGINVNQRPNSSGIYNKTARRGKRKRRFTSWKPPNKGKLVSWPDFHICVG